MVDDILVVGKYVVGEPVVPEELPHIFLRVQLRAFRRQLHDGDVDWHREMFRDVPASLVKQQHRVVSWRDVARDFGQMVVHGLGVALGHDQTGGGASGGADGAEYVGRHSALIRRCTGAGAPRRPAAGELGFLAYPGLVAEPDFDLSEIDSFCLGDCRQCLREFFLKSSMAPSACS